MIVGWTLLSARLCTYSPNILGRQRWTSVVTRPRTHLTSIATTHWFGPSLVAVVATCAVLMALDPAGDYPSGFEGPGLTVDEIFNVEIGVKIADRFLNGDIGGTIRAAQSLPDHPPLGRFWLGLVHELVILIVPPAHEHAPLVIAAARAGSAVAFGILIWLIGHSASQWFGRLAGWTAAISLVLMPRVFGHAHLAALETVLNLTYAAAIITVAKSWTGERAPSLRIAAWCGLWLGFALLTKIQAIFIPIPVGIWALANWRARAIVPLAVWGLTGLLVFFCGWPWLWIDPLTDFLHYLGHASDRSSVQVWYFGHAVSDKEVPWHYPWVIFATTVPLGLHVLGIYGAATRIPTETTEPQRFHLGVNWLLLGSALFPLVVFSIPGLAVYDGERLFLIVYPLWALFIGRGAAVLERWLATRISQARVIGLLTVFLALQSWGLWQVAPCWLSYYNSAVGGLAGADKVGLQTAYWGDSVTRELWTQTAKLVPEGSAVDVAPILHQFQIPAYYSQCPAIRDRNLKLQPYQQTVPAEYLILFSRREYLPQDWNPEPPGYKKLAVITRQGVILAGVFRRDVAKR